MRNDETRCVELWLDNMEGDYHAKLDIIREASSVEDAAEQLKAYCEELLPDLIGWAGELLRKAFQQVDFEEIVAGDWSEEHPDDDTYGDGDELPPCVLAMRCYCAGHARGNLASAACDTSENGGIE
jgi:hypothetical protein